MIKFTLLFLFLFSFELSAEFHDEIKGSGIKFIHDNGGNGKYYMPEIMGAGVAFFDYDNDGDMDVYLVQSGKLIGNEQDLPRVHDRLYRNDTSENDKPVFIDVTKQAKILTSGFGIGVATGDLDNNGFEDVFIARYGENQVLMNQGDGTFVGAKNLFPKSDRNWSVGASITDYNKDGYLDLYVVNYVKYPLLDHIKTCRSTDSSIDYCSPQGFKSESDYLYKNNGDGTFTNVSGKAGLKQKEGPGLGVIAADFNNDNKTDFYVANDGAENHLWLNRGDDEFFEAALVSGVAVNMSGEPEASMGVDAADHDNDGDIDLFMTHLKRQTNTLYVNNGKGWFSDLTMAKKLGSSSFKSTGFGTIWFDIDNDGLLDLFSANGSVSRLKDEVLNKDLYPYKQINQVWQNIGNGKYSEITQAQGAGFLDKAVSRGAALADFDNDGDLDILVSNNNSGPQFLVNKNNNKNSWIGLKLFNSSTKRVEVGAIAIIENKKSQTLFRWVKTDGSYSSSHDNRVHFGLGEYVDEVTLKVIWLDGAESVYENLKTNMYHKLNKR